MPVELWSALIAAGAALAGVALTGLITWAVGRGADRRADAREDRRATREAFTRQQEIAKEAADEFLDHLTSFRSAVRQEDQLGGPDVTEGFSEAWDESLEIEMRQIIDRLSDDDTRRRLQLVVEAVDDYEARVASGYRYRDYVPWLFALGRELSMAAVRGQEPDNVAAEDLQHLTEWMHAAEQHRDLQREPPPD